MNKKEAEKWMELKSSDACPKGYPEKWHEAYGFMEGYAEAEKNAHRLVEALDVLIKNEGFFHIKGTGTICRHCMLEWPCRFGEVKEVLSAWEKEK